MGDLTLEQARAAVGAPGKRSSTKPAATHALDWSTFQRLSPAWPRSLEIQSHANIQRKDMGNFNPSQEGPRPVSRYLHG